MWCRKKKRWKIVANRSKYRERNWQSRGPCALCVWVMQCNSSGVVDFSWVCSRRGGACRYKNQCQAVCVCMRALRTIVCVRVCACGVAFTQVTPDHRLRHRGRERNDRTIGHHHSPSSARLSPPSDDDRFLTRRRCGVRLVGTDHLAVLATKYARLTSRRRIPSSHPSTLVFTVPSMAVTKPHDVSAIFSRWSKTREIHADVIALSGS